MILSNVELQKAIDEKRLLIEPEPLPRTPTGTAGEDCRYQTSSVDLCLGDEISYFKPGRALDINLSRGGFAELFGDNSVTIKMADGQPFVLRPHMLVLGKTLEKITLPIIPGKGKTLAARVEGKSSYARCGLLVHFTAPTIHAGFSGTITLELINLGPYNISLYPGTPICQLIVETVHGTPFRNDSQFQNQSRPGGNVPS